MGTLMLDIEEQRKRKLISMELMSLLKMISKKELVTILLQELRGTLSIFIPEMKMNIIQLTGRLGRRNRTNDKI